MKTNPQILHIVMCKDQLLELMVGKANAPSFLKTIHREAAIF